MTARSRWAGAAGVLLVMVAFVWAARRPITASAVDRYFTANGVSAAYRIVDLAPGGVVLRGVRIGPASQPDLTAERVDLRLGWTWLQPQVMAVRLVRPALHAALGADGISFGSLDRLLPAAAAPREPLPDIDVTLSDGRLRLDTFAGAITVRLSGSGRLPDGFQGSGSLASPRLVAGGCAATAFSGRLRIATRRAVLALSGNGGGSVACSNNREARTIRWSIAGSADQQLHSISGIAAVAAPEVVARGAHVRGLRLRTRFALGQRVLDGRWSLVADRLRMPSVQARGLTANGDYTINLAAEDIVASGRFAGRAAVETRSLTPRLRALDDVAVAGPFAATLADAISRAGRQLDVSATVSLRAGRRAPVLLRMPEMAVRAASGARLTLAGGSGLTWSTAGSRLDGTLSLSGDGMPAATLRTSQLSLAGAPAGQAALTLSGWHARGLVIESLALTMSGRNGWLRGRGQIALSGEIVPDWSVTALDVRTDGRVDPARGVVEVGSGCTAVRADKLSRPGVQLSAMAAALCPLGAVGPALLWRDGQMVVDARVTPSVVTLQLADGTQSAARIGATLRVAGGVAQARGGLDGFVLAGGGVPVRLDRGSAEWALSGRGLTIRGGEVHVRDAAPVPRFEPLRLTGVTAQLTSERSAASGAAQLAARGQRLFGFTAMHDLITKTGSAQLVTGPLHFSEALQPYEITEALRGIVENAAGTVAGTGRFDWTPETMTSSGRIETADLSFATAALGPVQGLRGAVSLDDLVAMTSPPGQQVTVASINPGILVENGTIRFRMLGPAAAAIEQAVWPFADGWLALRPVTVRAGEQRRAFTLDVEGADAQAFLERFELPNLKVTGTFDGTLPLVFDGAQGRIEDGLLTARPPGGLIQYVGEVGTDSMGAAGRLAFDALKRLRYKSLSLAFDGDLDGEIVTAARFSGTNEAPVQPTAGVPVRASGLPFRFNVTVRAPFRRLLGAAQGFGDARAVIRGATLPTAPEALPAPTAPEALPGTPPSSPVPRRTNDPVK